MYKAVEYEVGKWMVCVDRYIICRMEHGNEEAKANMIAWHLNLANARLYDFTDRLPDQG